MAADFETFEAQLREANEEINRRSGRPLLAAVLTGLVLGGLVMTGIFFKPVMVIVAVAATVAGSSELANALRGTGRRVPRIPVIVVAIAGPPAGYWLGSAGLWAATLAGIAFVALWRIVEQVAPASAPRCWCATSSPRRWSSSTSPSSAPGRWSCTPSRSGSGGCSAASSW